MNSTVRSRFNVCDHSLPVLILLRLWDFFKNVSGWEMTGNWRKVDATSHMGLYHWNVRNAHKTLRVDENRCSWWNTGASRPHTRPCGKNLTFPPRSQLQTSGNKALPSTYPHWFLSPKSQLQMSGNKVLSSTYPHWFLPPKYCTSSKRVGTRHCLVHTLIDFFLPIPASNEWEQGIV